MCERKRKRSETLGSTTQMTGVKIKQCADTVYTQYKERTYNIEISQIMTNTYHVYIDSALYNHATVGHGERETYMYMYSKVQEYTTG